MLLMKIIMFVVYGGATICYFCVMVSQKSTFWTIMWSIPVLGMGIVAIWMIIFIKKVFKE